MKRCLSTQVMWEAYQVTAIATAKPGQFFVAYTMHNLVVEPLVEESEVVMEERVEE